MKLNITIDYLHQQKEMYVPSYVFTEIDVTIAI